MILILPLPMDAHGNPVVLIPGHQRAKEWCYRKKDALLRWGKVIPLAYSLPATTQEQSLFEQSLGDLWGQDVILIVDRKSNLRILKAMAACPEPFCEHSAGEDHWGVTKVGMALGAKVPPVWKPGHVYFLPLRLREFLKTQGIIPHHH